MGDKDKEKGNSQTSIAPRNRRHVEEMVQLQNQLRQKDAQLLELKAQLLELQGLDFHRSERLQEPFQELTEALRGLERLNERIWGSNIQTEFNAAKTRQCVRQVADGLTIEERLNWVEDVTFVPTPQVMELQNRVHALMQLPAHEVHNLRVCGDQGSGKTWATLYVIMKINERARPNEFPCLYLDAPVGGEGLTQLHRDGLTAMREPRLGSDTDVEDRFYLKAIEHGVRIFFLDEGGTIDTDRKRNHLRRWTNKLKRPIVVVSAEPEWYGKDQHLAERFKPLMEFGPYRGRNLADLLMFIEAYLPFRQPSFLYVKEGQVVGEQSIDGMLEIIQERSHGDIKTIFPFIRRAARVAVIDGHDRITRDDLLKGWENYLLIGGSRSAE